MLKKLFSLFFASIIISCQSEQPENILQTKNSADGSDYYYWYKGEKIELHSLNNVFYISSDSLITLENTTALTDLTVIDSRISKNSSTFNNNSNYKLVLVRDNSHSRTLENNLSSNIRCNGELHIAPVFGSNDDCVPTSDIFYVKTKKNSTAEMINFAHKEGVAILRQISDDWYELRAPASSCGLVMSNKFYESGVVQDVDPGFIFSYKPSYIASDPMIGKQYYLDLINAPAAWETTTGSQDVTVAIIDTGVDRYHGEISNNMLYSSFDIIHSSHDIQYYSDHGTLLAGIIAANHNNQMIAGIAPSSSLMSVGVDTEKPYNQYVVGNLCAALNYAYKNNADIINCSWGDYGGANPDWKDDYGRAMMEDLISTLLTKGRNGKGAIVICAAGNRDLNCVDFPAKCNDDILVVGSIDKNSKKSYFSSYGSKLDIVCPGEDIVSIVPNHKTGKITGTSASAPQVSATASLILSINPNLTGKEVRAIIESTATNKVASGLEYPDAENPQNHRAENGFRNDVYGYGILNVGSAVEKALSTVN